MEEIKLGFIKNKENIVGSLVVFDMVKGQDSKDLDTFYIQETISFDKYDFTRSIIVESYSLADLKKGISIIDKEGPLKLSEKNWTRIPVLNQKTEKVSFIRKMLNCIKGKV